MALTFPEVESQARKLSEPERARLALTLIESLDTRDDGDVTEAWRVEVDRRGREIEDGTAVVMAAAEVFEQARNALK